MRRGNPFVCALGVLAVAAFFPPGLSSAEQTKTPTGQSVEMFAAIDAGEIGVRFIPRNDREGRLIITNKTERPLSVKLPDTFVGAPVLAQQPPNRNNVNNNTTQAPQAVSTMPLLNNPLNQNNNINNRPGNNIFNIPPEKVIEVRLTTVCLEHGKKNPRPAYVYEVKRLESYTSRPALIELFKAFAQESITRRAAQAATWHVANDMTWEQLSAKRLKHLNAPSEPYFTRQEIESAKKICATAEKRALESQERAKQASITLDARLRGHGKQPK